MKYSAHRILKTGHIEIRQIENRQLYRYVIAPNQSIDGEPQDVKQAILSDPNYERYRTQENAEAYEARLK